MKYKKIKYLPLIIPLIIQIYNGITYGFETNKKIITSKSIEIGPENLSYTLPENIGEPGQILIINATGKLEWQTIQEGTGAPIWDINRPYLKYKEQCPRGSCFLPARYKDGTLGYCLGTLNYPYLGDKKYYDQSGYLDKNAVLPTPTINDYLIDPDKTKEPYGYPNIDQRWGIKGRVFWDFKEPDEIETEEDEKAYWKDYEAFYKNFDFTDEERIALNRFSDADPAACSREEWEGVFIPVTIQDIPRFCDRMFGENSVKADFNFFWPDLAYLLEPDYVPKGISAEYYQNFSEEEKKARNTFEEIIRLHKQSPYPDSVFADSEMNKAILVPEINTFNMGALQHVALIHSYYEGRTPPLDPNPYEVHAVPAQPTLEFISNNVGTRGMYEFRIFCLR